MKQLVLPSWGLVHASGVWIPPSFVPEPTASLPGCRAASYFDGAQATDSEACATEHEAAFNELEEKSFVKTGQAKEEFTSHLTIIEDYDCPELREAYGEELARAAAKAWLGRPVDCHARYIIGLRGYVDGMGQVLQQRNYLHGLSAQLGLRRVHSVQHCAHEGGPGRLNWTKQGLSPSMASEFLFRFAHAEICESVLRKVCPKLRTRYAQLLDAKNIGDEQGVIWQIRGLCPKCNSLFGDVYRAHYWYARTLHPLHAQRFARAPDLNVAVHVRIGDRSDFQHDLPRHSWKVIALLQHYYLPVLRKAHGTEVLLHVYSETPQRQMLGRAPPGPLELEPSWPAEKLLPDLHARLPGLAPVEWHIDEDDFSSFHALAVADAAIFWNGAFARSASSLMPASHSNLSYGGMPGPVTRCNRACFDDVDGLWALIEKTRDPPPPLVACVNRCSLPRQLAEDLTKSEL